jgi:molecular chaperone GrpE (heat shock protein)
MSDLSVQELAEELTRRLDDVLKEVRRQGRAAIAAQAAAESCLEALQAQGAADAGADEADPDEAADGRAVAVAEEAGRWLRALLPVADAVERVVRQASALEVPSVPRRRGLFERLLHTAEPDEGRASRVALAEGLRVLGAQLEGTLRDLGAVVDRRTGSPVDGERQRVVEVRPARPGERPGTVVEVVRPGYTLTVRGGGERILREAEVVIAEEQKT